MSKKRNSSEGAGAASTPKKRKVAASGPALFKAAWDGDLAEVERMLAKDKSLAKFVTKDLLGRSALEAAAQNGHESVALALIKAGARVTGDVLHAAARSGNGPMVQLVLKRGAFVDHKDEFGATALLLAAQQGHAPVVAALLQAGANTKVRDEDGVTPLKAALNNEAVALLLLRAGAPLQPFGAKEPEYYRQWRSGTHPSQQAQQAAPAPVAPPAASAE